MADSGTDDKKTFSQKFSSGFASFKHFLYHEELVAGDAPDRTQGLYMGRTRSSWAKIGLFYLIFYGFLAAFFAVMLTIFLATVKYPDEGGPKLTQFIKNQPGLTRLDSRKDDKIPKKYDPSDQKLLDKYSKFIKDQLAKFDTPYHSGQKCVIGGPPIPKGEKPCIFDQALLGRCNSLSNDSFGLASQKPCVFIKINRVYDWIPKGSGDYLTLSCNKGTVMPPGYLLSAFPYRRQKGYKSPLVAVQIDVSGGEQEVECTLKGEDISVSDSFNAARAYGKIKFKVSSR